MSESLIQKRADVQGLSTAILLPSTSLFREPAGSHADEVGPLTSVVGIGLFQRAVLTMQRAGIRQLMVLVGPEENQLRQALSKGPRVTVPVRWMPIREFPLDDPRTWESLAAEVRGFCLPVQRAGCICEPASFDRICCSYAIYHFPYVARALDEMFRVARPRARIVLTGPTAANNKELYRLHEFGESRIRTTMGRDVFQSSVDEDFARRKAKSKFTEYLNVVRFPSREEFIGNYAVTKLFLDNVAAADRDAVLSRLRSVRWPSELASLSVTKTVGVYVAWT